MGQARGYFKANDGTCEVCPLGTVTSTDNDYACECRPGYKSVGTPEAYFDSATAYAKAQAMNSE